jgi:DNA helicase-2/ATP-dependent DNA helicase PcrA
MKDYLGSLNRQQLEAVLATEGPVLIVAGAGAGKTKTLTTRIAHLIETGVRGDHILAVTFTNKAAGEMRERVQHLLGEIEYKPTVKTFHSLGVMLLRFHSHLLGRKNTFTILDESDVMSLVKDAMKNEGIDPKQYDPKMIRSLISKEKANFVDYDAYANRADSGLEHIIASIWRRYEAALAQEEGYDFDDLLLRSVQLLKKHIDVREIYQRKFTHILVDEYQDINSVQYELTKLLVGENQNICAVGDTDQNIYSWRGAEMAHMLRFERDFPNTKVFFLEENYRSTKTILGAANAVIKKNTVRIDKTLFTNGKEGDAIELMPGFDENYETRAVAERIVELRDQKVPTSDIAILYRTNFLSRGIEEALLEYRIPYQVLGTKFFDRREVKDVLAYIRVAFNRDSTLDMKRTINTPLRGIGKASVDKLLETGVESLSGATQQKVQAYQHLLNKIQMYGTNHAPSELVVFVLKETGLEAHYKTEGDEGTERLENVYELAHLAERYTDASEETRLASFLDDAALLGDQDTLNDADTGVRLMTVHAAKGLEFKYVFIIGLEEGIFPHSRSEQGKQGDREEERRLFYVALTRAKEKLFLSYAQIRTQYGMREVKTPSSFINEIPDAFITMTEMPSYRHEKHETIVYLDDI